MSAYLASQTTHLQSLHQQLGLPATSLAADEARIEAAVKAAITSLINEREREVDDWKDGIASLKVQVGYGMRAVGDKGRNVVDVVRRESFELESLPKQHARLMSQRDELLKVYQERLTRISEHQATLDQLATLLGSAIEAPQPLVAISNQANPSRSSLSVPGSSTNVARSRGSSIGTTVVGTTCGQRKSGNLSANNPTTAEPEVWLDVGEDVMERLENAVAAANEERINRLKILINLLRNLTWLHYELILPPIPISSPHHFPINLLPSLATEERPGSHLEYQRILAKFAAANPEAAQPLGEEDEEKEVEIEEVKGIDGVEPEVGLMVWAEQVDELWANEKVSREARIQELYDQIEPLWSRMNEEQDYIDVFIDSNRGSGEATIKAYEIELERVLEIRRSSLSQFVLSARAEIELLSDELMMSEEEKAEFGPFIDDDYTEPLLHAHEQEVERLRAEIQSKAPVLARVKEWYLLEKDSEELENLEKDPNRFSKRGGGMLREEKLRKRVGVLKPKIEAELLKFLPAWEESSGRPFMVHGQRVVDQIIDALEAKEAAKEAKKRAKSGLAPTPLPRSQQTPSVGTKPRSTSTSTRGRTVSNSSRNPPQSVLRKREAPTPTPMTSGNGNYGPSAAKRQKTTMSSMSSIPRYPSTRPSKSVTSGMGSLNYSTGSRSSSPTPQQRGFTGLPSVSVFSNTGTFGNGTRIPSAGSGMKKMPPPSLAVSTVSIGGDKKRRRESFKPRPSMAAGGFVSGLSAGYLGDDWGGLEEEDEGDVF